MRVRAAACVVAALLAAALVPPTAAMAKASARHWVGAWEAAPEQLGSATDMSYRLPVSTSIGGSMMRLRFSNSYGKTAVTLRDVNVARPTQGIPGPSVDAATMKRASFGGHRSLTLKPGANAYTDPIAMNVTRGEWLMVSFYAPGTFSQTTGHSIGMNATWSTVPGGGNAAGDPTGSAFVEPAISYPYLEALDVAAPRSVSTVVLLGDSITDCCFEVPESNTRWGDVLNDRLAAAPGGQRFSVVNAAISGNNISNDRDDGYLMGEAGDTRVIRDVFDEPNVSTMVVFEGINDVGTGATAREITNAYRYVLRMARERHIRVVIAKLTPCKLDYAAGDKYVSNSATRDRVNTWITKHRSIFDGVIDFNKVIGAPFDHDIWNPAYTIGDQLHPNPLGMRVMGNSIPLSLFRSRH